MDDRQKRMVRTITIVISVIVGVLGLLVVAAAILFAMAFQSYGSNK